ncbi:MAG TPA: hypothetical protein VE954_28335 [Oligoflexus sp.]|uniref:hypothetical protein n=1 Tax=Oligoflexus sp. TaxID=1971216 RepID=UPI002D635377|nr:hypothetical protein [Oligoflexus sp.]HYX37028.1 hypothetical protein [Oligoflexus sp.]
MQSHHASHWDDTLSILQTELKGSVTREDVLLWKKNLHAALERIPDGRAFRLLLDLKGFEPVDIEAHKAMRLVIPHILLSHGMRPAYADLFDDPGKLSVTLQRSQRCFAFANVHHDENKMGQYEMKIGRSDQRFFTDPDKARQWLIQQPVPLSGPQDLP